MILLKNCWVGIKQQSLYNPSSLNTVLYTVPDNFKGVDFIWKIYASYCPYWGFENDLVRLLACVQSEPHVGKHIQSKR